MKKTGKFKVFILIVAIVTVIVISTASLNNKVKEKDAMKLASDNQMMSDAVYYYGSSSSSNINELLISETDLSGAAPANIKFGINTINGKMFYVNNLGQWVVNSASVTTATPLTTIYTPPTIPQGARDEATITLTGVLLANFYALALTTDISTDTVIIKEFRVMQDNTISLVIENTGSNSVTLPALTIAALKLN